MFGGTFDPPHNGHLIIAGRAVRQLKLDKVIFVPAYIPPHKTRGTSASPTQRYTMMRMVIRTKRKFAVASVEIKRKGVSYTIDTLRDFRKRYRRARLFLIVGGDNYRQFRKWKSASEILKLATLVVYDRLGSRGKRSLRNRKRVVWLKGVKLDLSSTMIRNRVKRGEPIRSFVPRSVEQFIRRHRLYQ